MQNAKVTMRMTIKTRKNMDDDDKHVDVIDDDDDNVTKTTKSTTTAEHGEVVIDEHAQKA